MSWTAIKGKARVLHVILQKLSIMLLGVTLKNELLCSTAAIVNMLTAVIMPENNCSSTPPPDKWLPYPSTK